MDKIKISISPIEHSGYISLLMEQYKLIASALNNISQIREASNSFWITANSISLSALGYFFKNQDLSPIDRKKVILIVLWLGLALCISWMMSLMRIKSQVEINNNILVEIEKYMPAKVFTCGIYYIDRLRGKNSITSNELIVPALFLLGYIFFAFILIPEPSVKF